MRLEYTPWGEYFEFTGLISTNRRSFTGHDWDSASLLYYTLLRYFGPERVRWSARDPLGMIDGPNLYQYVVGNPVSYVDTIGGGWVTLDNSCADDCDAYPLVVPDTGDWRWRTTLLGPGTDENVDYFCLPGGRVFRTRGSFSGCTITCTGDYSQPVEVRIRLTCHWLTPRIGPEDFVRLGIPRLPRYCQ